MTGRARVGVVAGAAAAVVVLSLSGAGPFSDLVAAPSLGARGVHSTSFGRSVVGSAFGNRGFALLVSPTFLAVAPGHRGVVHARMHAIEGYEGAAHLAAISPSRGIDVVPAARTMSPSRTLSVAIRVARGSAEGSYAVRLFLIGAGNSASAAVRLVVKRTSHAM